MIWARRFADGLLGKARALLHGLGPKGEYPSRWLCHWGYHKWRWHSIPRDGVWRHVCVRRGCHAQYDQELVGWS
jgi:hypothetical protein